MSKELSRRGFITTSAAGAGLIAVGQSAKAEVMELAAMPLRPLGKTGRMISIVGFGGGSRYILQEDLEIAERMIDRAIELGISYFDTAYTYTNKAGQRESHQRYGKFLVPNYRNQITLSTKLSARDAEGAKKQFDDTINDLQTDHIDILHFHGLTTMDEIDQITAKDGALKFYHQLKDEGVIKHIGITGHADSKVILEGMKRIEPEVVMCPQNPAHDNIRGGYEGLNFGKDVLPYGLEHGIGLLAMKTTAQNTLIGRNGVPVEKLIQYALTLPVAAAVIGMPSLEVVESNAKIARTLQPMDDQQRQLLNQQIASALFDGTLPYLQPGYYDGKLLA